MMLFEKITVLNKFRLIKFYIARFIYRIRCNFGFEQNFKLDCLPVREGQSESLNNGFHELKIKAGECRKSKNHQAYESLLKEFDANIKFLDKTFVTDCEFIGYGLGDDSLNVFRKIRLKDKVLFEKIYCLDSHDYKRLLWFETYLSKDVQSLGFVTSSIYTITQGKFLAVVYFEFLDVELDNLKQPLRTLLETAIRLNDLEISVKVNMAFQAMKLDFTHIDIYQKSKQGLMYWMQKNGLDSSKIDQYEKIVKQAPHILNHGDLHGKNMGMPNIVIDWDRAGLYPVGFDLGYILSNEYKFTDLKTWLVDFESFHQTLRSGSKFDIPLDLRVFCINYFLLIFYIRKINKNILIEQYMQLLDVIEDLYGSLKLVKAKNVR